MNQYLIDYTVRNITTGDEEEVRVLELADDEFDGFPSAVRPEIIQLIRPAAEAWRAGRLDHDAWSHAQDRIVELLSPYISDPTLYAEAYEAWESSLLESVH